MKFPRWIDSLNDREFAVLMWALMVVFIIFIMFVANSAKAADLAQPTQYGGGWGICGPYGCPPPGAYDDPPLPPPQMRNAPRPRAGRRGPQGNACIFNGECGEPEPDYNDYGPPPPMPPFPRRW